MDQILPRRSASLFSDSPVVFHVSVSCQRRFKIDVEMVTYSLVFVNGLSKNYQKCMYSLYSEYENIKKPLCTLHK